MYTFYAEVYWDIIILTFLSFFSILREISSEEHFFGSNNYDCVHSFSFLITNHYLQNYKNVFYTFYTQI